MKIKMSLLALSLVVLVFAALPAVASAGEPVIDAKAFPLSFTSKGTHAELRIPGEPTFTCTGNAGTGKYTSSTTGEVTLTFTGCKDSIFGASCTTTGQTAGTIKFGTSAFHSAYLTDARTTPGLLITPPTGGTFATFTCASFFSYTIGGNGIIGHLESPKCGASSTTDTLNFTAAGTTQTYRQVTGTGTIYSLTGATAGGSPVAAAEVAELTVTFADSVTLTCT